mgnify:CR=1 FL=1
MWTPPKNIFLPSRRFIEKPSMSLMGEDSLMLSAGGAAAAATVTFAASETQNATNPYTHNVDIGSVANRKIVVWCGTSGGSGATGATATVAGDAMTEVHALVGADFNEVLLFERDAVTATGLQDIVITWGSSTEVSAMSVWEVEGASTTEPTGDNLMSSSANPPSGTIDVPAGGVCISGCFYSNCNSATWAGLTERHDDDTGQHVGTGASDAFADAQSGMTITSTPDTSSQRTLVAAAWASA